MFKTKTTIKDLSNYLFLGGDIHKNNHTFVALNPIQQKVGECEVTDNPEDLQRFKTWIEKLKQEFGQKVALGLEDSSGNGEALSKFLTKQGYEVCDINPSLTARRRKREPHQDKSDSKDALLIAKTLISEFESLPRVKVTSRKELAKALKGLIDDHDLLVKQRTRLKNQLHQLLYQKYGPSYKKKFRTTFSKKALSFWIKDQDKEGACKNLDPKHVGLTAAPSLLKNIRKLRIKQKAGVLLLTEEKIKILKKKMKTAIELLDHRNLLTLDGCGILVVSRLVGEVKDIKRFATSSKLAKHAGLAPMEYSSGKSKNHRNSRWGNRQLNKVFYRIALSQIGVCKNEAAVNYYEKKLKEGKSKSYALKLLARRNVDIVFAMMRDNSDYDLERHLGRD